MVGPAWPVIKNHLGEALSLPTAQRARFLAELAVQDEEVARQVGSLLDISSRHLIHLEAQTPNMGLEVGARLGTFEIERLLGSGGMGAVYLARQLTPHDRRVALKIGHQLLPDAEGRARFEREREILAGLSHDHIARLYESGTTATGQPFFVMEYVPGQPICKFADAHRLTVPQRLSLMHQVCGAVAHAHTRGIIHRDLKPSNILVHEVDGVPIPKVIDFGIAREMGATRVTLSGMHPGTPRYMSPEQIGLKDRSGNWVEPDFRTDVYALGVVLFELVVGVTPFALPERASPATVAATLCEKDAPSPTRRIAEIADEERRRIASARGLKPERLGRALGGDLPAVLAAALAMHPRDRYTTPLALAADLEQLLVGKPVAVTAPDPWYLFKRYCARHRLGMFVLTLLLLILPAFTAVTLWQNRRFRAERDRAEYERARAQHEAETSARVTDFMISLFKARDPYSTDAPLSVSEIVSRGAEEIQHAPLDLSVRLRLFAALGEVYLSLGKGDRALALMEDVHAFQVSEAAVSARVSLLVMAGSAQFEMGQLEASKATFEKAESLLRMGEARGDLLNRTLLGLGLVAKQTGQYRDAEAYYREALSLSRESNDDLQAAVLTYNLAALLRRVRRFGEAESFYRESLELRREHLPPENPLLAYNLNGLALLLMDHARYQEAEPLLLEALELRQKALGDTHPLVGTSLNNLGGLYFSWKDYARAETFFMRALAKRLSSYGTDHYLSAQGLRNLARNFRLRGQLDVAEDLYREALSWQRRCISEHDPAYLGCLRELGLLLDRQHRHEEAADLFSRWCRLEHERSPGEPSRMAQASVSLALCLERMGQFQAARELLQGNLSQLEDRALWQEACALLPED